MEPMKRILVIEDDPDIQELIRNFLQDAGYLVSLAGDGLEGWRCFRHPRMILFCWIF